MWSLFDDRSMLWDNSSLLECFMSPHKCALLSWFMKVCKEKLLMHEKYHDAKLKAGKQEFSVNMLLIMNCSYVPLQAYI